MTIIVGMLDEKQVVIGTDSLYTWEEGFVKPHGSKFVPMPKEFDGKVIVASSGQEKFSQIFERIAKEIPKLLNFTDRYSLMKLAEKIRTTAADMGVGDAEDNNLPEHDLGFLIASKNTKKLWTIDSDYSVGEYDNYVCVGSGYIVAESAILALTLRPPCGTPAAECRGHCAGEQSHSEDPLFDRGSGFGLSLDVELSELVKRSLQVACQLHPYCGGGTHYREIYYD